MPDDVIRIQVAKDEKDERAQRQDLIFHNACEFIELGGKIPELDDLKKNLVEHLNTFVELNKQKELKSCEEAYDLAVAMFEVKKHLDKAKEAEALLDQYSSIVRAMVAICEPEALDGLEASIEKTVEQFLAAHPKKHCGEGVCYQPIQIDLDELAREDGSVVHIKVA